MNTQRIAQLFSGLILLVTMTATQATNWGLSDLMQILSQNPPSSATFVEKKTLAMLREPLESSGELSFTAPDQLEKRTLKPKPESIVLTGDKLMIERSDGRKITLRLSDRPEVAAFIESIRATLAGDRSALERYYTVSLAGSPTDWQLTLVPLTVAMQKTISQVHISGTQAQIKTISYLQADGDRSDMTITSQLSR